MIMLWKMTKDLCPHKLPGHSKLKSRRRNPKKREKLRRLLHNNAYAVSSWTTHTVHHGTWRGERTVCSGTDRESPRRTGTWRHHSTQEGGDPHPQHWGRPYRPDAHHVARPCGRRASSEDPSSAGAHLETPRGTTQSTSNESLVWTQQLVGRTFQCPEASCRIQTRTATTTAWIHTPPSQSRPQRPCGNTVSRYIVYIYIYMH